jgi:UDP-glucose 4-epimerase
MSKRVLITGASGFVGANLARRLLHDGHAVHLLVRQGYAPWRIAAIANQVQIHQVDLCDTEQLGTIVGRIQPEWIFHLAAYGAYSSQTDLQQTVQTNMIATINLVQACLQTGFEAFINTGSSSEYGFKDHAPAEDEWVEPNSYYAVTKASAALFCRYTAQRHGVHIPTLRLYSVYGPYEEPTRLMPALIMQGLRGALPPLVNPAIARDYVYTEDVNDAFVLAATQPNQAPGAIYNVGTGVQTSLRQVVDVARRTLDISAEPQWGSMPDRMWDTSVWVANNQKIRDALQWEPRYSFEQGFRAMVAWFTDHPTLRAFYDTRAQ